MIDNFNSSTSDQGVTKPLFATTKNLQNVKLMAERVGFEPTVPLTVHKLSKPAPILKIKYTNINLISKLQ